MTTKNDRRGWLFVYIPTFIASFIAAKSFGAWIATGDSNSALLGLAMLVCLVGLGVWEYGYRRKKDGSKDKSSGVSHS